MTTVPIVMPWWEDAIRAHAARNGPSGGAWNISMLLECLSGMAPTSAQRPYQERVDEWTLACFGAEVAADKVERNHRFLEEALELVQSIGCTQSEAHQLVDYVFGRPVGEPQQEVGGVMVTLAALCSASEISLDGAAETELARIWTKMDKIRVKHAAKPKHSPLPGGSASAAPLDRVTLDAVVASISSIFGDIAKMQELLNQARAERDSQKTLLDKSEAYTEHALKECRAAIEPLERERDQWKAAKIATQAALDEARAALAKAEAEEREACAQVIENWHVLRDGDMTRAKLAKAIRARTTEPSHDQD